MPPSHLSSSSRTRRAGVLMSEINITPMVDVMLVLLIVFMVAAPLLTVGVKVNLPDAAAKQLSEQQQPLTITINAAGEIFLQDNPIPLSDIVVTIQAITEYNQDQRIYVRGDQDVSYGEVAAIIARLNAAGFRKVALVTENVR